MTEIIQVPYLPIKLGNTQAKVLMLKVKHLDFIQYVAVRGRDREDGAVQRVLSPIRIKSIEDYVLKGNIFYTPFFLNWTNLDEAFSVQDGTIAIPLISHSAQILDGQHRMVGLERAMEKKEEIGDREVLVILTDKLDTEQAAQIFLNINTEQRPVQKSLIYDLFGLINGDNPEMPLVRANDIANYLNDNPESPYYKLVKMPGNQRGVGVVDLSSIVGSLKAVLSKDGIFFKSNIETLERQYQVIQNYLLALRHWYDREKIWSNKTKNPFMTNAGFITAIEIMANILIPKCIDRKNFREEMFYELLNLEGPLLTRSDIKNQDGKSQRKTIYEYLESSINSSLPDENGYQF